MHAMTAWAHSAKYGAYTILCCTLQEIIHFDLIQVIDGIDHYTKYTSTKHNPRSETRITLSKYYLLSFLVILTLGSKVQYGLCPVPYFMKLSDHGIVF